MRLLILSLVLMLSGCTAMLLGGQASDRSATGLAADIETTTAVQNRLSTDEALSRYSIGVSTYHGRVTLSGAVLDYAARSRAGELARGVSGVISVDNRIRVRPVD